MSDEIERIIIRTEGEERVRQLAAALASEEERLRALVEALGRHDALTRSSAQSVSYLNQQLAATRASMDQATSSLDQAGHAASSSGHQIMQLGQTIDDLQYVPEQGLRPIINNIMQISPAIGIALVAGQALYSNWDNIIRLFGQGATKSEADSMEALGKKTEKTAQETAKLLDYEQKRKNLAAQSGPTKAASAQSDAINEAIKEAPVDGVRKAIDQIHGQAIRNSIDDIKTRELDTAKAQRDAAAARAGREPDNAGAARDLVGSEKRLSKAQQAYDAEYGEKRDAIQANLASNPKDFTKFVDELDRRGIGTEESRTTLRAATPEAREEELEQKAQDHFDREDRASKDRRARWEIENLEKDQLAKEEANDIEIDQNIGTGDDMRNARLAREAKAKRISDAQDAEIAKNLDPLDHEKERKEAKKKADKEAKEENKARTKAARDSAPGIDELIRDQLVQMGGSSQAARTLTGQLRGRFGDQADELVHEQLGSAREKLMTEYIKGPEKRNSQVIGSEGLAASIQSAVGSDDTAKKQLEQLQRQTVLLNAIAAGRPLVFRNGALGG